MESCIFCQIVAGKSPSYKVYEDDKTLAFLDLNPSAPGHSMVILKKHGLSISDYEDNELKDLMRSVKIVDRKLQKALNCKTMTIGINQFEHGGVPHLHFHLIPRFPGDGGGIIQTIVYNRPKESLDKIADKIRNAI